MSYRVRFESVSKRYPRGGPKYGSIRQDISGAFSRLGRRLSGEKPKGRGPLALDAVSFEVGEGESFGIVGPNGAGKTTALKMISRISYPSGGRIRVRGRVAALIEVGSGVHPELTARENIRLYGQILGMGKNQVRDRFDQIVDFAELSHVLDTPVKMYSSGMQLRLGFAIAAHLDPEIFVVDEALAVGDASFQAKCVERMTTLVAEGRTILFVSHNLAAVEALCHQAIFLHEGKVLFEGPARETVARYLEWVEETRMSSVERIGGSGPMRLVGATCHSLEGEESYRLLPGEGVEIRLRFEGQKVIDKGHLAIGISDGRPGILVQCSTAQHGGPPIHMGTSWEARVRFDSLPLRPRLYQVFCDVVGPSVHRVQKNIKKWTPATAFRVVPPKGEEASAVAAHESMSGAVDVPFGFTILEGDAGEGQGTRPVALGP